MGRDQCLSQRLVGLQGIGKVGRKVAQQAGQAIEPGRVEAILRLLKKQHAASGRIVAEDREGHQAEGAIGEQRCRKELIILHPHVGEQLPPQNVRFDIDTPDPGHQIRQIARHTPECLGVLALDPRQGSGKVCPACRHNRRGKRVSGFSQRGGDQLHPLPSA